MSAEPIETRPSARPKRRRVAVVNSHPIQYFAPLYAYINRETDVEMEALYLSDWSLRGAKDHGFGQVVTWDVDLLSGYPHQYVGERARTRVPRSFGSIVAPELWSVIRHGDYDAVLVHGHAYAANLVAIAAAKAGGDRLRVHVTADPDEVLAADRIVLPGVGAFAACMDAVEACPGLVEAMTQAVQKNGKPFLGVCVGMQLLATRGLEFGERAGLGWNALTGVTDHPLFDGLGDGAHMYFTHSFALYPADVNSTIASVDHGGLFTAAVASGNVAGVQFHPEKSQTAGLRLLSNFLEWRP